MLFVYTVCRKFMLMLLLYALETKARRVILIFAAQARGKGNLDKFATRELHPHAPPEREGGLCKSRATR